MVTECRPRTFTLNTLWLRLLVSFMAVLPTVLLSIPWSISLCMLSGEVTTISCVRNVHDRYIPRCFIQFLHMTSTIWKNRPLIVGCTVPTFPEPVVIRGRFCSYCSSNLWFSLHQFEAESRETNQVQMKVDMVRTHDWYVCWIALWIPQLIPTSGVIPQHGHFLLLTGFASDGKEKKLTERTNRPTTGLNQRDRSGREPVVELKMLTESYREPVLVLVRTRTGSVRNQSTWPNGTGACSIHMYSTHIPSMACSRISRAAPFFLRGRSVFYIFSPIY